RMGDLPKRLVGEEPMSDSGAPQLPDLEALNMTLDDLERWAIVTTLKRTGGHLTEAVRILGIGRTTLYRKLKKYKIDTPSN
ncbi:MAG: helix-turn-helix domain-containing protein, partial [Polyangiales bacterium]